MKMYLFIKQLVKENYRYFSTMLAGAFFLMMIYYVGFSTTQQSSFVHYASVCLMCVYAVSCPLVLFHYLYHPTNVHHVASIPMTRFETFFSGYLFGLFFGFLMILGYTTLTSLLSGTQDIWIYHTTYLMLTFVYYYHLSIFCYWICGNKLFYGLMVLFCSIGPFLFYLVFEWMMESFVLGYQSPGLGTSAFQLFLPLLNTFTCIAGGTLDSLNLFYLGISAVLLILSMVAVHYRQMEKTGHSISFAALGYFIRFVICLLGSSFLLGVFMTGGQGKMVLFISYLLICLMVTYCVEMVFSKKTNVLYSLKYGVLLSICGFVLMNGVTRYLTVYVPEYVEGVSLLVNSGAPYTDVVYEPDYSSDPETIELVKELHHQLLGHQSAIIDRDYYDGVDYYPVFISYQTSTGSYSNRLYYCDAYLYTEVLAPYLENQGVYDLTMYFENKLIDLMDDDNIFNIHLDEDIYLIDTKEKRYLFKNYLKQELASAHRDPKQLLNDLEQANQRMMLVTMNEGKQPNQYWTLTHTYSPIIERAVMKIFKE